jgi:hypothetical protein
MKSITIHDVDGPVFELLKERAHNDGVSLNKTIKKLLDQALGIKSVRDEPHRGEFKALCGKWGREEKALFDKAVADFEKIDPAEWQ